MSRFLDYTGLQTLVSNLKDFFQTKLGISSSGSATKFLNEKGEFVNQSNADWNSSSGVSQILNKPNLATVATSGSYTDLSNKPTIPAAQVNADWNETSTTSKAYILNKPSIPDAGTSNPEMDGTASAGSATTWSKSDHVHPTDTSREAVSNKVTSWSSTLSDTKYPSEKLVKESLDNLPPGTAVKGDAESEYRTGNVNLTPANIGVYSKTESDARFKAVQTPVSDPAASGSGLSFIDSVSQNANGEITPNKKTVQDGTTSQKGVVQLSNAINSTSTTEAATPKAVKDAYDELNNKIIARAVFLSQAEWSTQSQLPGDPAKVYYVEDGTGEDAYTVYVWNSSTSAYVEVDESSIDLDGYWHDGPNTTGNGNVVTGITLGNDGVPVLEKGITALTQHQDISGKADKVSNATNGNFASLDSNGNLTDSGKKAEDFAVSSVYNETDPRNLRSFIKCEGSGTQFYRKLATALDVNNAGNSSVIKLEGCVGAWGSGDTTDFSIVVRTRGSVLFEVSVFKRIGSNNAFDKVNFELYEESNGTYSLWLNSSASYTKCAINAFAYGGAYIVYDGTNGTPTGTLVASASQNYKVMMVTDGDGSKVSVTPDGTSTGYDLGSSTTLKAFAQKFKNLVGALKALAFKDKVSDSDISGTISDTHIASASTWSGKQSALPTTGTASTTYAVNISGNAATATTATTAATANSVPWAHVTNKTTASTGGVYGIVTYTTVLLDEV